jgi:hypothetical protein
MKEGTDMAEQNISELSELKGVEEKVSMRMKESQVWGNMNERRETRKCTFMEDEIK